MKIIKVADIKKFERLNSIELPKDTISETGVIGTLLMHPEFIYKSEYLKPNQFYNREFACVYHIIQTLTDKGISEVDNFIIMAEIEGNAASKSVINEYQDISKDICGWLDDLKLVARNDIESYELISQKVIANAFKRDSYIKLREMATEVLESKEDINATNFKLQTDIADFSKIYICNEEVKTLGKQVDRIWEGIMAKRTTGFFGFPSSFSELNRYATYEKTELLIFAAPAKTAKSQILSNEAWNLAISGVPSLYIDRELSTENHMLRMLAYLTGIENRRIKTGELTLKEDLLIKEKLEFIKKLPYTHIYKPLTDMGEMYATIKSQKLKSGIEFLSYDYLKANDGSDGDKEYQKLGRLTDWLKNDIAGSLDLAVAAACQMDRGGTKVADSSKIERNCSTLAFVNKKTKEEIVADGSNSGNLKLYVPFNRNGAVMEEDEYINLRLFGDQCRVLQAKKPFKNDGNTPY